MKGCHYEVKYRDGKIEETVTLDDAKAAVAEQSQSAIIRMVCVQTICAPDGHCKNLRTIREEKARKRRKK